MLQTLRLWAGRPARASFASSNICAWKTPVPSVRPFAFRRRMATHRDMASVWRTEGSSYGSGGSSGFFRFWQTWKVPLLFTGGVLLFDYYAIPAIINFGPFDAVRRNPQSVVYGIMALNFLGFLAWKGRGTYGFMYKYGLLQKDPRYFNAWSMLGSAFSHQDWWHVAINMFVLYQFGMPVAQWMGAATFLESYLDSCVLSSLGSMLLPILLRRYVNVPSLGASGAVFSTFGTFCYLVPGARLAIWFIPVPFGAWWVFLGTTAWNVFALLGRTGGNLDYAGHIAGSMCGIFWGWMIQKKIDRIRAARERQLERTLERESSWRGPWF